MDDLLHACCFAGAGGTCTGFRAAGYRTLFAIEWERHRAATLRANHRHAHVIQADIRRVPPSAAVALLPRDGSLCRPLDVLTVSAPCESFSTAAGKPLDLADGRDLLFWPAIRIAEAVRARVVLMENVPPVLKKKTRVRGRQVFVLDLIRQALEQAGYEILWGGRMDASHHGLPQRRRRWFLVAAREPLLLVLPRPTTKCRQVTVREAFGGLPSLSCPGRTASPPSPYSAMLASRLVWPLDAWHDITEYHVAAAHRPHISERLRLLPAGRRLRQVYGQFEPGALAELKEAGLLPPYPPWMRYRRLRWDAPAPTVLSKCSDLYFHPEEDRCLTNAELARRQGFPDGYRFVGSRSEVGEQIGDAVPPYWAYQWAVAIGGMLRRPASLDRSTQEEFSAHDPRATAIGQNAPGHRAAVALSSRPSSRLRRAGLRDGRGAGLVGRRRAVLGWRRPRGRPATRRVRPVLPPVPRTNRL